MIVDLSMPGMDGFETTKWIFKHFPAMHVMIFSMHDSDFNVIRLLKMGVKSFLSKEAELDEIGKAINSIIAYGSYFPPTVTRNLITLFHNPENESFTHPLMISENEIKFLNLACTELTYIEIADQMFVSPRTVENYRNKLTEKWDVKTRTGLVVYALKNGIILP
jgi:DNA-binding NarL/FixJ family response regulator